MTSKRAPSVQSRTSQARLVGKRRKWLSCVAYAFLTIGAIALVVIVSQLISTPLSSEGVECLRAAGSILIAGLILGALAHWDA